MKFVNILILFILVSAFVSCEDREADNTGVPVWLQSQLKELEDSGECDGCTLQRWTYDDDYYYHLYCSNWSCSDCVIYDTDGNLVVWGEEIDHLDYEQNKYRPIKIWECGDEF
jgi:hypothetical protein